MIVDTETGTGLNISQVVVAVDDKNVSIDRFRRAPMSSSQAGHARFPSYASYQSANTDSPLLAEAVPPGANTPRIAEDGGSGHESFGNLGNSGSRPSRPGVIPISLTLEDEAPSATRPPAESYQSEGSSFDNNALHNYKPDSP